MIFSRVDRMEATSCDILTVPQRVAWGAKAGEAGLTRDRDEIVFCMMVLVCSSGSSHSDQAGCQ